MGGQSALEYLMTYGWALFIIAIVAIALWRLGVFAPMTKQEVLNDFTNLTIQRFKLINGDIFQIEIVNTWTGSVINITSLTIDTPFADPRKNDSVNLVLEEGKAGSITVNMSGTSCDVGKMYTINVTIEYYRRLPNGSWSATKIRDKAKVNVLCESI